MCVERIDEAATPRTEVQLTADEPATMAAPVITSPPAMVEVGPRGTVMLVPLGSFPNDLLDGVEAELVRDLQVEVIRHEPIPLPEAAWYAPRKRWRAEKLLDHLDGLGAPGQRILGLTEVDISTTKGEIPDWGIFGLANMPGRSAVVSSKRLTRRARDREQIRFRVGVVAVHEVGHSFGLDHCPEKDAECVMLDAEGGIENTDSSSGIFGPACQAELDQLAGR